VDAATIEQYVAELRTVHLTAEPGSRHVYCSGNYNVLGRMIEGSEIEARVEALEREAPAPGAGLPASGSSGTVAPDRAGD